MKTVELLLLLVCLGGVVCLAEYTRTISYEGEVLIKWYYLIIYSNDDDDMHVVNKKVFVVLVSREKSSRVYLREMVWMYGMWELEGL